MTAPKDWLLEAKERCKAAPEDPQSTCDYLDCRGGMSYDAMDFYNESRTDLPRAIAALEAADSVVERLTRGDGVRLVSFRDITDLQVLLAAYLAARHGDES